MATPRRTLREGQVGDTEETSHAHLADAIALQDTGRYRESAVWLKDHLIRCPGDGEAWVLLCQACLREGQIADAVGALDKAMSLQPETTAVQINLARVRLKQKNLPEALEAAEAAVAQAPEDPDAKVVLAACLTAMKRGDEALALLDPLLAARPTHAEALANRALVRLALGQAAGAAEDAERAALSKPDYATFWALAARTKADLRQYEAAADALGRAQRLVPPNLAYAVDRGEYLRRAGRAQDAIEALDAAVANWPSDPNTWQNHGLALQDAGRLEDARRSYSQALVAYQARLDALEAVSSQATRDGDVRRAAGTAPQAARIRQGMSRTLTNRCGLLKRLGELDLAEADGRSAVGLDPANSTAWFNLAAVAVDRGAFAEARELYAKSLSPGPNFGVHLSGAADHHMFLGEHDQAIAFYTQSREVDPSRAGLAAAVKLAVLAFLDDDRVRARRLLDEARAIEDRTDPFLHHAKVYWKYLDRLLQPHAWPDPMSPRPGPDRALHVIGESHALAAQALTVHREGTALSCRAHWIPGCKQWHLGRTRPDVYKLRFEAIVDALPPKSSLLIVVGEIDCRLDEGILSHARKTPGVTLAEVIETTVTRYLDYVRRATVAGGHDVIIQGVPCPNSAGALEADQRTALERMIQTVNARLRTLSLAAGFAFLDVHALTDAGDGRSNGRWHIDGFHLKPHGIVEAFETHLFQP